MNARRALPPLAPGGSDAMNPRPVPPPRAPGGSDFGRSSVLASVLQTASSISARANVRDSQLGSLAQ